MIEITGTLGIEVVDDKDPQHSISVDFGSREWETLGLKPNDRVRCILHLPYFITTLSFSNISFCSFNRSVSVVESLLKTTCLISSRRRSFLSRIAVFSSELLYLKVHMKNAILSLFSFQ